MLCKTGDIFKLLDTDRLVLVESIITISSITLVVLYPISYAVYMASNCDFIIMDEQCLDGAAIAECWNKLTIDPKLLGDYVGHLSKKYLDYFSTFVYFTYQSSDHPILKVLTGPPIISKDDIRRTFQIDETTALHSVRSKLISSSDLKG